MAVVTGAMGSLLPKLQQLLMDEYKLQKGVRKEVKSLTVELESIYAALRKVADVPWDQLDEQVKIWAREVRESSYDMEDVVDTFLVRIDGGEPGDTSKLKQAMKKMANLFSKAKARHDIAGTIKDIKKQLQEVAERRGRYTVDNIVPKPATSTIDPRLAAMYKEVTQLIGIDKSRGEIISMLTSSSQGDHVSNNNKIMKMVSVVGAGGLGKTTLAKAVYDQLKGDFDCGCFVPVGRSPDLKKVLKDILIDLDKQHCTKNPNMTILDERQLIDEIRELLKNKRYFVVIDDIWEPQSWETIKLALVENNFGSRVITTTRKLEVAIEVGEVYRLQPLSFDNSKKLLYTRIFGAEGKCLDNKPDQVSDKILKKCGGIPLAIITMASLLVGRQMEEWSELYSAIGFGHKDNRHVENTMKILSFSYYDLPSHLKTCLLYLSAFPEDYLIDKDSLIWKWIAEGFVHEKQGKWLFEIGEGYFNDLINRSMIQAVESVPDCTIYGCRVHDMVLDLTRSLSREENFVAILDEVEGTSSQSSIRRLANQNNVTLQANQVDMPQVRSYIVCRCDITQWVSLSSFKLLRVLAIEEYQIKGVRPLENIGNLLHLRYLGLSGIYNQVLPRQIGDLKFLQTLDLMGSNIQELPASIVQLTQLVCLRAGWVLLSHAIRVPNGIGKLTSLEELRIYAPRADKSNRRFVKELGSLRELRVLRIDWYVWIDLTDESMERDLVESLRNLNNIHHLSLQLSPFTWDINADVATWEAAGFVLPQHLRHLDLISIHFSRLPSCINLSRLHSLSYLELHVATVGEQDLRLLGRLPELLVLSLDTKSTVTVSNINANDGYFQKLRCLRMSRSMVQFHPKKDDSIVSFHIWNGIDAMPFINRENVPSAAVMPNLQMLSIRVFVRASKDGNVVDYGNIIGLEYLTSLQSLVVWMDCTGASAAEVEEAEATLRNATSIHPNHPGLKVHKTKKAQMISSVQYQEREDDNLPTKKEHQQEENGGDDAKLSVASSSTD